MLLSRFVAALGASGLCVLTPVVTTVGCSQPLSAEECNGLLDHYVSLLAASDRPGTSDIELLRLQAEARQKALHDPAFRRCASEVSRRKFECAMQAPSADRLEQCLL
jgi:hypothetical protein